MQIYDWCFGTGDQDVAQADAWINDVCRISPSGNNAGNPLSAFFFFAEQLAVQNLGKSHVKLFVDDKQDRHIYNLLVAKYGSIGFIDDTANCQSWTSSETIMKKDGLIHQSDPTQGGIDFSFLTPSASARASASAPASRKKTKGGKRTQKRIPKSG
jgi:hypothetical protein